MGVWIFRRLVVRFLVVSIWFFLVGRGWSILSSGFRGRNFVKGFVVCVSILIRLGLFKRFLGVLGIKVESCFCYAVFRN